MQISKYPSKIIIGTAQFGMSYGIANQNGQVHQNEITAILDMAWENGISMMDTAKAYGTSEESIGNYLKQHSKSSWEIITKIGKSRYNIVDQINDSIFNLTTHPYSVLAHSAELFLDEAFQSELKGIKDKGLIKKIGVSLYNENEINKILESSFKPDIIQLPCNILDNHLYHSGILDELYNKCIEIHARSVFLQGLFYLNDAEINKRFSRVLPYLKKLKLIAEKCNLNLAELSLLWLLSLKEVSKVVIGVDNAKQLSSHLKTVKKTIDSNIIEEALSIHFENDKILNPSNW